MLYHGTWTKKLNVDHSSKGQDNLVKDTENFLGQITKIKLQKKTSLKGFSASKCDVGNYIFSKLGTF